MWTAASLIEETRHILQDVGGDRYTDRRILQAAQTTISEVRRLRPDYFTGALRDPLPDFITEGTAVPTTPVPLPELLRMPVTTFCAGWCELADDQYQDDSRAVALMRLLAMSITRPQP